MAGTGRNHGDARHGPVPLLSYGTAWKKERTEGLVRKALAAGFRGIDTANQLKHYFEAGVGAAIAAAIRAGEVERKDLFLQTKFTFLDGQDHRLPYDPAAPIAAQVEQSFASSLEHLGVARLDSYVLHGPSVRGALADADWEAWAAMERLQQAGKTRLVGVSNVTLAQLKELHAKAVVKPAIVQNRCYASRGWDREVRAFCTREGILYQGFSLLTANQDALRAPAMKKISVRTGLTPTQIVFRFAVLSGMVALTGTTSPVHMAEDLAAIDGKGVALRPDEVEAIEKIVA